MEQIKFKGFIVEEQGGRFVRNIKTRSVRDLPENDLLIRVRYSSLNYKDALSASGNKGITKITRTHLELMLLEQLLVQIPKSSVKVKRSLSQAMTWE